MIVSHFPYNLLLFVDFQIPYYGYQNLHKITIIFRQ